MTETVYEVRKIILGKKRCKLCKVSIKSLLENLRAFSSQNQKILVQFLMDRQLRQ